MTKKTFWTAVFSYLLVLVSWASTGWCQAPPPPPSLILTTSATNPGSTYDFMGNGIYYYELSVPGNSVTFTSGDLLTLSGMTGVTSSSVVPGSEVSFAWFLKSSTSTDAIFQMRLPTDTLSNDQGLPYGFFEIDPPGSSALGTINWTLQTSTGTFSGTTLGPASPIATPEPSTLALIGLGIASLTLFRLLVAGANSNPIWR
jgi:hypothetical protein